MKFSNKSIVALTIFSKKAFHATASEDAAVPFVITSNQEKRLLNTCATFLHEGSASNNADNWYVGGNTNGQTLQEACDPNLPGGLQLDCCNTGVFPVNANDECTNWNILLPYTLCDGACKGSHACHGIAKGASGGSVRINSNACKSDIFACMQIGSSIKRHLDVEVGSGACVGPSGVCHSIGGYSQSLTRIEVPPNECKENASDAIGNPRSMSKCMFCGAESTHTGEFVATDQCCAADGSYYSDSGNYYDDKCNGSHAPSCATFLYDSVSGTWRVGGNRDALAQVCDPNLQGGLDCCNSGFGVNNHYECDVWNEALSYSLCDGACRGPYACYGIAQNASTGSVTINSNACTSSNACFQIGGLIKGHLEVEVGLGACVDFNKACDSIGSNAQSLTRIEVPQNECKEAHTTRPPSRTVGKCTWCGFDSTHTGDFVATDQCCDADGFNYGDKEGYYDTRCNGSQVPSNLPSSIPSNLPSSMPSDLPSDIPSDIPSDQPSSVPSKSVQPSSLPSSSPSKSPSLPPVEPPSPCANQKCNDAGKCEVTSTTEFKCVCEDTFINSANGRNCVCPPGFIRKSDNRCYDPTTPSPIPLTKAPTASPVIKTLESSSPTKAPTDDCNDDENAKFYLIRKPTKSVKCFWLTKNTARTSKRIANYCGLNRVKNICKSTCSFCTCDDDDSFSFKMINREKNKTCGWLTRNQKNRAKRIERYCTGEFDDGSVMNACTKSCGLCK